jgi:hypothetical protein
VLAGGRAGEPGTNAVSELPAFVEPPVVSEPRLFSEPPGD